MFPKRYNEDNLDWRQCIWGQQCLQCRNISILRSNWYAEAGVKGDVIKEANSIHKGSQRLRVMGYEKVLLVLHYSFSGIYGDRIRWRTNDPLQWIEKTVRDDCNKPGVNKSIIIWWMFIYKAKI